MLAHLIEEPVGIFLLIMAVILIAPLLSNFVRLPGIVGLIFGGLLIGPFGLGLLEREGIIEVLATVGLIYLMFSAGAEIDLNQFNRVRNKSLTFGALTFVIPQIVGSIFGLILGFSSLGAVLLGSIFASHTLIAFPVVTRLGIAKKESISVTVGATIFTDIGALLVLAAVVSANGGSSSAIHFLGMFLMLAIYTALILLGVPRLGRAFFRRFNTVTVEFQFVLVVIFMAAFLAELIGMEAIVGAFLAGLALNASLPHHSPVMARVLFIGESFFIPVFLLSIGMILNLNVFFTNPRSLLVGMAMVLIIYTTKYAAAWLTGYIFGYAQEERIAMWGLSQAQAAATLAAALVGVRIGLLDDAVFNGVILMILFTCVTSPLVVERFGPRLLEHLGMSPKEPLPLRSTFERVLVPVANPATEQHLLALAGLLTYEGTLLPVHVAQVVDGRVIGREEQHHLLEGDHIERLDRTVQPIYRVDTSVAKGILNSALEHDVTSIIMGWHGRPSLQESVFGSMLDEVVWSAKVPVLVSRLIRPINSQRRVCLILLPSSIPRTLVPEVCAMATLIAHALNVPLVVLAHERYLEALGEGNHIRLLDGDILATIQSQTNVADLLLITTSVTRRRFQSSLGTISESLAQSTDTSMVVLHYPAQR